MEIIVFILLTTLLIEVSYLVYRSSPRTAGVSGNAAVVDTSALMDGRIVTAAQTGFIPSGLIIPKSVIAELQLLADQADNEKRARARRGLDAIKELQELDYIKVKLFDDGPLGEGGVDARLVELATKFKSPLCTIDFNLNKVATVQGVRVLNINDLAGRIRMAFLPGESVSLNLSQKGQSSDQAVGYLSDGTMVVVDKAAKSIGQTVQVEFIRSLQTNAGRMMFARLAAAKRQTAQTRGMSTGRSRMFENNSDEAEQTRGTSAGHSRMLDEKAKQPASSVQGSPKTRTSRARKGPSKEDRLIELVNDQDA